MKHKIIQKGETSLCPIVFEVEGVHGHVEIKNQCGNSIDNFVMRGEHLFIRGISFYDKQTGSNSARLVITNTDTDKVVFDKEYPYCDTTPGIIFDCFDRVIKLYMGDATSVPTMPPFAIGSADFGFSVTVCEYVVDLSSNSDIIHVHGVQLRLSPNLYSSIIFRDRDYYQNKHFQHVPKWDIYGVDKAGEEILLSSGCNGIFYQAYSAYKEFCFLMNLKPEPKKPGISYRKEYNLK